MSAAVHEKAHPCCDCACGETVARAAATCFDVAECQYAPDLRIQRHQHERAALCLVLDGGYSEENGHSTARYEPATLVFQPAGATHTNVISSRGSRCLIVEIVPEIIATLGARVPEAKLLCSSRHGAAPWLAYKLHSELRAADALTPLVIDGVGLALLAEFVRGPGVRMNRVPPAWLARVREYLHDEFVNPPSLEALAGMAGVHRVHLARAFRKYFATTVGEYVRLRRIQQACHRLSTSDTQLSEVALLSGFSDQSHFTTVFRRLIGITPGDFRSRTNPRLRSATHAQTDVAGQQDTPRRAS